MSSPAPARQSRDHATTLGARARRAAGAAALGIVPTVVFLGTADALARLMGASTAPLLALSQTIIALTPPAAVAFAIEHLGTADKPVLLLSVVLGGLVVAAGIGLLARRRPRTAAAAFTALEAGLVCAVAARPGSRAPDLGAALLGAVLGFAAFVLVAALARRVRRGNRRAHRGRNEGQASDPGRRALLATAGALAAVGALGLAVGRSITVVGGAAIGAAARLVLPHPVSPMPAVPASAQIAVDGAVPFITPAADFYRIDTALTPPDIAPEQWSLRVHGLVEEEFTLSMDELLSLPLVERALTMTCVSNPVGGELVGTAAWLGYPLRSLLARARPQPEADMVLSGSIDGFTAGTPLEAMRDGRDALLAIRMNGEQLRPEHGFPARLIVPGLYGFVSATKWVTNLEVTRFDRAQGYWTKRGWDERGPILAASRIEVPGPLAQVPAGTVVAAGTAWAQRAGVRAVQVRLDDGDWRSAHLATAVSQDTWRQWRCEFPAVQPGLHALTVRAIDGRGRVQTAERRDSIPNTATGHHRIQFTAQ
ncbi:molybdopterin-dependent oxidoreductase [Brevibacterium sp. BRM-1]|uniref:molybdopterin-dependent oxidoreductase n=1 Tax=Brevibacterium sp. BRM-1 TaxID=2999062 RepID=UPI0022818B02|nr:molybdopterin-dependent oxidoreductase [Brevibacterium sp. BRM-1]WAL40207.1 molybdopterin-dependent oxidoreductase [Brevibacterium sp. BRM-1]